MTTSRLFFIFLFTALLPGNILADNLVEAVAKVATQVDRILTQEDQRSVDIGLITPKSGDRELSAYGRRIAEQLRTELLASSYLIEKSAPIRIVGQFALDETTGAIKLEVNLVDRQGNELSSITSGKFKKDDTKASFVDAKEVLLVSQVSQAIPPNAGVKEIVDLVRQQESQAPQLKLQTQSLSQPDLGLSLGLWELNTDLKPEEPGFLIRPIPPQKTSTGAEPSSDFQIARDVSYAIELENRSKNSYAVEVLIDGISSFALCEDRIKDASGRFNPAYQYWIVKRGSKVTIPGWFKNLSKVSAFQVCPDEQSVAFRLGETDGIGKIQVLIHAAWADGEPVPPELIASRTRGTGEGKSFNVKLTEEKMNIGVLLGAISVSYEPK